MTQPVADVTLARQSDEQRRANVRLALILASVALLFGLGFVVKIWLLGPN